MSQELLRKPTVGYFEQMDRTFPNTAEPLGMVEAFVSHFVGELEKNPILMPRDALGEGLLEENMSPKALLAFKDAFHQRLDAAAGYWKWH